MKLVTSSLLLLLQGPGLLPLTGRVVDAGNVLSADQEARLTARLEALERETSTQFVIVTIPTLSGEPIEDYTFRLAESWQIGQAGLDNGTVVLAAIEDRRARIEVGYGLEGAIPDGLAGRIIRERLVPAFQREDYYGGFEAVVDGLELAAREEYPAVPPGAGRASRSPPQVNWTFALVFFFLSGIVGNAMGTFATIMLGGLFGFIFTGFAWWGFPLGAVLGLISMAIFRSGPGSGGGWTYHPTSGGGWSGGGGFGGGGGFSGGGGGFGGGGASGSW